MTEPTVGQVFRAYAVVAMAATAAWIFDLGVSVVLLPLTGHEDTFAGPGTIAEPTAWAGFAVLLGVFWVAVEWWLPRQRLWQTLVMAGFSALVGFGYLIGDPSGASTMPLRLQGLLLIMPIGLVLPVVADFIDRMFATLRWWWMAAIAVAAFIQTLAVLGAFAERVGNVPVVYPAVTGLLFSVLTVIRWSRSEEEAKGSPAVRRLAVALVVAMALVGLATGLVAM